MRRLDIRVQAENLDASHELVELFTANLENFLQLNPRYRHYQINLIPQESSQVPHYCRSTTSPYYLQNPAFNLSLNYSFAHNRPQKELDEFTELEAFAQRYEQFVHRCLESSADYMSRVSDSGFRAIRNHQNSLSDFVERERERWRAKQSQNTIPTSNTPIFFRAHYDNYHHRRANVDFGAAIALSLISIPIFFIEPITASFLLLAAVLFFVAGLGEKSQAKQSEITIII